MRQPNFVVLNKSKPVTIKDIGPWDQYPTVTNGIEEVIKKLIIDGLIDFNDKFIYYDSEGELTQVNVSKGKLLSFSPV